MIVGIEDSHKRAIGIVRDFGMVHQTCLPSVFQEHTVEYFAFVVRFGLVHNLKSRGSDGGNDFADPFRHCPFLSAVCRLKN